MEFRFENKTTTMDLWKLSMHRMYHSMVGVCNIIFTAALIALTVRFWNIHIAFRVMMIFACVLFPIIQPVAIWKRAARQIAAMPKDMMTEINKTGVHVTGDGKKSHLPWNRIRGAVKEYGMVLLVTDAGRGYMLTDKTLGDQKEAFLKFVDENIKHK